MSAQRASAPVRLVRAAAAVVLTALAVVVIVRLAGRRATPVPPSAPPPPEGLVVDVKERVRHEEYEAGRLVADIRGDTFFLGPDGRNHLTGSVEITNLGPAGEVASRLTAGEVVYEPGSLRFTVRGGVRVEAGDLVLEGDAFNYDKPAGLFFSKSGGRFTAKSMTGKAKEVAYAEGAGEVRLGGGFEVDIIPAGRPGIIGSLAGDSLVYRRGDLRGRVDGRARYSSESSQGQADSISFVSTEDEKALASVSFEGRARIVLLADSGSGRQSGYVHADKVVTSLSRGAGIVSAAEAAGAVVFALRSGTGPETVVQAEAASLEFGEEGGIERWSASGGFRAVTGEGDGRGPATLEGGTAAFEAATGILRVTGPPGRPAVADSPRARIEAATLAAGPADGDLEASGNVVCLLKPAEKSPTAGLFPAGRAVSVAAGRLIFRGGPGEAAFSGGVRISQDTDFLAAGEIDISEAAGGIRGRGGVTAGLACPATRGAPDGRVELGGESAVFSEAGRTFVFKGRSYVRLAEARLGAATVTAVLGGEGGSVGSFTARTDVVLSYDRFEGRAGAASFEAAADRIVLTGRPVLTDREGGLARGAKLTFDLADDKILLENEGPGRSTTIIRS